MADENPGIDIAAMLGDAPTVNENPASLEEVGKEVKPGDDGAPGKAEANADGGAKPGEKPPAKTEPAEGEQKPPAPQATQPPAPDMSAVLREQTEQIAELLKGTQTPKGDEGEKPGKTEPTFNIAIPDRLLAAMASEDPTERGTATNYVINGAMNLVYNRMAKDFEEKITAIVKTIPQLVERQHSSQTKTKEIFDDFYGKFPSLNKELLRSSVQAAAKKLAGMKGKNFVWDEAFRDELGVYVHNELGIPLPGTGKPAEEQKPKPKEQPFQSKGGTRVDADSGKNKFLDSIGAN